MISLFRISISALPIMAPAKPATVANPKGKLLFFNERHKYGQKFLKEGILGVLLNKNKGTLSFGLYF